MDTKISRISETKRGRFALFNEGEFLFSVDEETLVKHDICKGSTLSDAELLLLQEDSDLRRAKDTALRYLSLRAYGEMELYKKLCQRFDEPTSATAVATMRELMLLDDETFALEKAKGMAGRGKSSGEIRRKLRDLGLDTVLVDEALSSVEIDDVATALRLVQKSYTAKLQKGERQKVMAALGRRGFTYNTVRSAIALAEEELQLENTPEWMDE